VDTLGNNAQLFKVIQNEDGTSIFHPEGTPLGLIAQRFNGKVNIVTHTRARLDEEGRPHQLMDPKPRGCSHARRNIRAKWTPLETTHSSSKSFRMKTGPPSSSSKVQWQSKYSDSHSCSTGRRRKTASTDGSEGWAANSLSSPAATSSGVPSGWKMEVPSSFLLRPVEHECESLYLLCH
jgi:hypothetical protein